jgi:primosomal protein N''
MKAALMVG